MALGALALLPWYAPGALEGCTVDPVRLPQPAPDAGRVTVFVHGYRGSFLDVEGGDRAWVSVGQLLTRGKRSLAVPFPGMRPEPTFEVKRTEGLVPGGPLTGFRVLPSLLELDVYEPLLRFGRDRFPGFVAFDYDWRRDVRESGRLLRARVDALLEQSPDARVSLVGHSMGGLVILAALHGAPGSSSTGWTNAARIDRVVFLATPFGGAPAIFDDLTAGTRVGRNERLLSAAALFTFPAAFQLLPPDGDFFVTAGGEPVSLELGEPEGWSERGWSVFADSSLREDPAYRDQLHSLLEGRAALADIVAGEGWHVPDTLAFVARGEPTVSAFPIEADGSVELERPLEADGDGSVTLERAAPPAALGAEVVTVEAGHLEVVSSPAVLERLARFLTE